VDFGVTALGEASAVKVKVTNHARLMQTFGFSDLPEVVSVAPSPYGEVLAGETIEVELRYAPIVATVGTHEFTVAVKTLLGARVFDLPCVGPGRATRAGDDRERGHAAAHRREGDVARRRRGSKHFQASDGDV
jgi:hypothetical protein